MGVLELTTSLSRSPGSRRSGRKFSACPWGRALRSLSRDGIWPPERHRLCGGGVEGEMEFHVEGKGKDVDGDQEPVRIRGRPSIEERCSYARWTPRPGPSAC